MSMEKLNLVANSLYTHLHEVEVYSDVYKTIEYKLISDIEKQEILSWLYYDRKKWKTECPPLTLYAKYLAIALTIKPIPQEILHDMFKAFIFYGSYDLVINISSEDIMNFSDYKLMKYIAKAYKSMGKYKEALEIYRNTLNVAYENSDKKMIALFLVLLGKLYDDYHQKKGMHLFYHKTAYEIVDNVENQNFNDRNWKICAECYAKADYKNNTVACSNIYKCLILGDESELLIRYKLNYWVLLINDLIFCYASNKINEIADILNEMEIEIQKLRSIFKNERVYAIRSIQRYSLVRKVILKINNKDAITKDEKYFKDNLQFDIVKCEIENCQRICRKYNEKKYFVYSLLELVDWKLNMNRNEHSISPYIYKECVELLNSALNVLSIENDEKHFLNSNIYIDVLHKLSQIHSTNQDFIKALESYNMIYDYLEILIKYINTDYKTLRKTIDSSLQEKDKEFYIFTKEQKFELISSLYCDYETLADRLLLIGKEINSLRYMDMLKLVNDTIKFSKSIDYHGLNRYINQIISMVQSPEDNDKDLLVKKLRQVERQIDDIRFNNEMIFKEDYLFTNTEAINYLSSVEFQSVKNNIKLSEESCNVKIKYNKRYFQFILNSLIYNIIEVAKKNDKNEYEAVIFFTIEENRCGDVVCLHIKDNVGSIEEYKKVIDSLNEGQPSKSSLEKRGYGLKLIKEITLKNMMWTVKVNGKYKELKIPICKLGGD